MADPGARRPRGAPDPAGEGDAGQPVPGSAGPLTRTVERLPDGRRLTLYRSPGGGEPAATG
jgi:hypothetical protein